MAAKRPDSRFSTEGRKSAHFTHNIRTGLHGTNHCWYSTEIKNYLENNNFSPIEDVECPKGQNYGNGLNCNPFSEQIKLQPVSRTWEEVQNEVDPSIHSFI